MEKRAFFPILTVIFLGYLGFSLALPLFPPLFLDPALAFLPLDTSKMTRSILLGLLFTMYPSGQFLGAPLLGKLSDKYGRKPILLLSLFIVIPTYISSALAIIYTRPLLLFISRFFSGLFEGNVVIAQATIADISKTNQAKTKNFGWIVSLSSSAFFFGPLISGQLTYSQSIPWFHYDTPFWAAAILVFIGFILIASVFQETHTPDKTASLGFRKIFSFLLEGLTWSNTRPLYVVNLFLFLGMFFFINFFSAFLVNRFQLSVISLGQMNAYLSLFLIFAPLFFGILSRNFTSKQIVIVSSFSLGISYLLFIWPAPFYLLFFTLIPIGMLFAIGLSFPAVLISDQVGKKMQGQALGTNMSIQVFAEAITALIGGFLIAIGNSFPMLIGAVCSGISGILLMRLVFLSKRNSQSRL